MRHIEDEPRALRARISELESQLDAKCDDCSVCRDLAATVERLRLHEWAMESSNEGIAIFDARRRDFPLVYVNAGFERQTGYAREEILGRSARVLHGPDTDAAKVEEIRRAMAEGREYRAEIISYRKDGTPWWNSLGLTPLRGEDGKVTHYVSVQTDITERVQSIADVESALKLLEATNIELTRTNRRMRRNLEAAAKVQQALLPARLPRARHFRFAWKFRPCEQLAGDSLNIFRLDDDHVGLYLLDVTGHGTAAALLAVAVNRVIAPMAHSTSVVRERNEATGTYRIAPPSEVARRLHRHFPWDADTGQFFTMIYGVIELRTHRFRYTTAGHPPPLYLPANGEPVTLGGRGMPIGVGDGVYEDACIELGVGDRVHLCSDGVSETMNGEQNLFGRRRMTQAFVEGAHMSLDDCQDRLLERIEAWHGSTRFEDDLSLLSFEFMPEQRRG